MIGFNEKLSPFFLLCGICFKLSFCVEYIFLFEGWGVDFYNILTHSGFVNGLDVGKIKNMLSQC